MSKASEWARRMHAAQLDRPTFTATVLDADGKQNPGAKDLATIIAIRGEPYLLIRRGGALEPAEGTRLAGWITETLAEETT